MIVRALPDFSPASYESAKSKNSPADDGLYYLNSGSTAIKFFLSLFGSSKRVGIQVFTCSTVKDAILGAEDIPVYMETNQEYYTTTLDIVKQHIDSIDILILSHICGIPNPDYLEIKELCRKKQVILLDDLCQTFHARVSGSLLEDLSDNYVYSFFYDKPIAATKGGALKVALEYKQNADYKYYTLRKESEASGKDKLNRLFWMSQLLLPEVYKKDFRTWCKWENWILSKYPKSWPILPLKFMVNPSVSMRLSKFFFQAQDDASAPKRMSDIQIKYIQAQMCTYQSNNLILVDILNHYGFPLPSYLKNGNILCSISKRAIVPSTIKDKIEKLNVEVALYNWNELIDKEHNYVSSSILTENINIPTSTRWYK